MSQEDAEEADLDFWRQMTPEERVMAMEDCLLSSLRAKGIQEIPPMQRVCRVVKRPRR